MKILLTFLFFTMSLTMFGQKTQIETVDSSNLAKWRSANYSDIKYSLDITLVKDAPLMYGEIAISTTLTDEGAKNDLILDWRTTQFQNDKDRPFINVQKVNNTFFLWGAVQPKNEQLTIPKSALKTGENIIKIQFASQIQNGDTATTRYIDRRDGAEYIFSQVSANKDTPFPFFDQPDLKARFEFGITLPGGQNGWEAVSNARLMQKFINSTSHGPYTDSYVFYGTKPISPYAFAFAAGSFETFNECFHSDELKSKEKLKCLETSDKVVPERDWSKIYVRKSQAEKFRKNVAEIFRLHRKNDNSPKLAIILVPEIFNTQTDHDGIKFVPESLVFR